MGQGCSGLVAVGCVGRCWWVQHTALSRSLLSSDKGRGIHPLCHDVWHPPQLDSDHHEARSPHHRTRCNEVRGGHGPCTGLLCRRSSSLSLGFPLSEPVCPWKLWLFLTSPPLCGVDLDTLCGGADNAELLLWVQGCSFQRGLKMWL